MTAQLAQTWAARWAGALAAPRQKAGSPTLPLPSQTLVPGPDAAIVGLRPKVHTSARTAAGSTAATRTRVPGERAPNQAIPLGWPAHLVPEHCRATTSHAT